MPSEATNISADRRIEASEFFASKRMYRWCFVDGHLVVIAVFLAILILWPSSMDMLLSEDGYVEIPTALLALGGAILAMRACRRHARIGDRRGYVRCLMFVMLCVLVLGEENDWGLRLLGVENINHDINVNTLHEVAEVAAMDGAAAGWRIAAGVIAAIFIVWFILALRLGAITVRPVRSWDRAQRLTLLALALLMLGQLRDLGATSEIGLSRERYRNVQTLAGDYRALEDIIRNSNRARDLPKQSKLAEPHYTQGRSADPTVFGYTLGPKFPEEIIELLGAAALFFAAWSLFLAAVGKSEPTRPPEGGLWNRTKWFLTED